MLDAPEKNDKLKAFYETHTKHLFGTVFCKITQEWITGNAGEYY